MASERVIVVGAGGISGAWFPAIKKEELNVVAVVDLRREAAEGQIAKYELKEAKAATSLGKALRLGADFVIDLTTPDSHHVVTTRALRGGVHVIGEKPMAASMGQARKMVQTSEITKKLYMVSQSRRWEKVHESVRATIVSGAIGQLTTINCDFFIAAHFGGFRDEMASPLILDMAIHHFDMARMFSGQNATSVYAEEFNPAGSWYKGDASANCLFEMSGGVRFAYRGSWCSEGMHTPWGGEWRFVGSRGTILLSGEKVNGEVVSGEEGFHRPHEAVKVIESSLEFGGMHGGLREMLRFLREGQMPQTECHDNIHSLEMVHGAIKSARLGRRLALQGYSSELHSPVG